MTWRNIKRMLYCNDEIVAMADTPELATEIAEAMNTRDSFASKTSIAASVAKALNEGRLACVCVAVECKHVPLCCTRIATGYDGVCNLCRDAR